MSYAPSKTIPPIVPQSLAAPGEPERLLGLTKVTWLQMGLVTLCFVALFWPNLLRLWAKTNPIYGDDFANWSHSLLVPLIGIYYLYLQRERLLRAKVRPLLLGWFRGNTRRWIGGSAFVVVGVAGFFTVGLLEDGFLGSTMAAYGKAALVAMSVLGVLALLVDWGLACLLGGMLMSAYGIYPGRNDYIKDVGMVMTLFGVVLTLGGWGIMRVAWFPIAFLICALPWPDLVYSKIALPLQFLAANVALVVLNLCQIDTVIEGTTIVMFRPGEAPRQLNVAEACAGMKSLMTFITAGAAIAFVMGNRPMWQKITIVASAVPIAILCNTLRVSVQGLLDFYVSTSLTEGLAHAYVGLFMLIPAFFMLLGVGWVLDQLIIEEDDDEDGAGQAGGSAGSKSAAASQGKSAKLAGGAA